MNLEKKNPLRNTACKFGKFSANPQVALVVKHLPVLAGEVRDLELIPGLGKSPGGGHGNTLWYSCLENPTDRGAWRTAVHRVAESRT